MAHNTLEWHRKKLRYYIRYDIKNFMQIQKDTIKAILAKQNRNKVCRMAKSI